MPADMGTLGAQSPTHLPVCYSQIYARAIQGRLLLGWVYLCKGRTKKDGGVTHPTHLRAEDSSQGTSHSRHTGGSVPPKKGLVRRTRCRVCAQPQWQASTGSGTGYRSALGHHLSETRTQQHPLAYHHMPRRETEEFRAAPGPGCEGCAHCRAMAGVAPAVGFHGEQTHLWGGCCPAAGHTAP